VGALRKFVVGCLLGLLRGPKLRSLAMDLQPRAPFLTSSWVAFRGCSLEHTNGGCQCWGSIAEGYQTPMREEKNTKREMESGMENDANSWQSNSPLRCPCGSIYWGGKGSYYNALNTPNQLPCQ
jgi:hypothetical protein